MSEVTNLRKSDTSIKIRGILAEKEFKTGTTSTGSPYVSGHVSIKVDDTNTIRIKVMISQMTSKGEENKAWAGIQTVMSEYKSIADVGEEAADRVYTNASFETYRNQNGQDVTQYKSNYFTRITGSYEPERSFNVECFIKGKSWETDSEGNETGRLKIKAISPSFNGIDILELVAPASNENDPNFAQDADSLFEVGSTYAIQGQVVNARVVKKAVAALGTMKGETTYKNELVITGSSPVYDEENAYNADAIKLAIQNYEDTQAENARKAAEKKTNADKQPFTKPSAAGTGRSHNF